MEKSKMGFWWVVSGLLLLACGCGGRMPASQPVPSEVPAPGTEISQALQELDALPTPQGVDWRVFTELKAGLRAQLLKREALKATLAAPDSFRSKVTSLIAIADGAAARFHWNYRNEGDYSQDSIVNVSDLTPLAQHFGKNIDSPDWAVSQVADGNSDSIVNLLDLVPIGVNYLNRITHYKLEYSASPEPGGVWTPAATILFADSFVPEGHLRQFDFMLSAPQTGYYRVTPYDGQLSGIPGNIVQWPTPNAGPWPMFGQSPRCTRQSPVVASQTGKLRWVYQTTGPGFQFMDALVGPDSVIYAGAGSDLLAINPNGTTRWRYTGCYPQTKPARASDGTLYFCGLQSRLYAVNADGELLWTYSDLLNISLTAPSIGPDGSVYIADNCGHLRAFSPGGSLLWTYSSTFAEEYTGLVVGPDGTIYATSAYGVLSAINPDGSLKWNRPTEQYTLSAPIMTPGGLVIASGLEVLIAYNAAGSKQWQFTRYGIGRHTPAVGSDGTVFAAEDSGEFYALSPDGSLKWTYTLPELVSVSPQVGPDGTVYVGISEINNGDNGKLYALNADGILQWAYATGDGVSSVPALGADGTVYVGSGFDNDACPQCMLHAIQPDGARKWTYNYNAGSNLEHASPAIGADGTIFVGSQEGTLYAIRPDGSQRWYYATGGMIFASPAVAADGTVYVGSGAAGGTTVGNFSRKLYAIDPDGSLKWVVRSGGFGGSSPVIGPDGVVYSTQLGQSYAIYPDGTLKWARMAYMSDSPALGEDGSVYLGADYSKMYSIDSAGVVHGSAISAPIRTAGGPAIGQDGTIYIASTDGKCYAVNVYGSVLWVFQTLENYLDASPAIGADGTVYFGAADGRFYALNADGTVKWSFVAAPFFNSSPAIGADGVAYIGCSNGKLYAINPDGSLKWSSTTGGPIGSSPAIGADGSVYVSCSDGRLYAFGD